MNPSAVPHNSIPVIDISQPSKQIAQQVLDAASTYGFLYIKNDGTTIATEDIHNMFKLVNPSIVPRKKTCLTVLTITNSHKPSSTCPLSKSPTTQSTPAKPAA